MSLADNPIGNAYLALWGASMALTLYALVRKRWTMLEVMLITFLMLSMNVLILLTAHIRLEGWIYW